MDDVDDIKHTPGPWIFCGNHVDDSRGLPLVRTAHRDFNKINFLDMHLIAAAPELLAALQDMLGGWRYIRQFHGDLYGVGWDRAQQAAEAAIAKATGEPS
jgi:hypothetical protein